REGRDAVGLFTRNRGVEIGVGKGQSNQGGVGGGYACTIAFESNGERSGRKRNRRIYQQPVLCIAFGSRNARVASGAILDRLSLTRAVSGVLCVARDDDAGGWRERFQACGIICREKERGAIGKDAHRNDVPVVFADEDQRVAIQAIRVARLLAFVDVGIV